MDNARLFALPSRDVAEPYEGDLPHVLSPFQARATAEGADFDQFAFDFIAKAGGTIEQVGGEVAGIPIDGIARGTNGQRYLIAAHGNFSDPKQPSLRRPDTVHKVGHRAMLLPPDHLPFVVIASHLPKPGTKAALYLARSRDHIFEVVATEGDLPGFWRLHALFNQVPPPREPLPAPWRVEMSQPRLSLEEPPASED